MYKIKSISIDCSSTSRLLTNEASCHHHHSLSLQGAGSETHHCANTANSCYLLVKPSYVIYCQSYFRRSWRAFKTWQHYTFQNWIRLLRLRNVVKMLSELPYLYGNSFKYLFIHCVRKLIVPKIGKLVNLQYTENPKTYFLFLRSEHFLNV